MNETREACIRALNVKKLIVECEKRPLDDDFVVHSKDEAFKEFSEVEQNVLMPSDDSKEIQRCLGLDKLTEFNPLLRAMGVTCFYRKNYGVAATLFNRMSELAYNDLEAQLMAAECEIMIGSSAYRVTCETFVEMVKADTELTDSRIQHWDELLRQTGRHVGRIILQFAACRRYVDEETFCILTPYKYFLKLMDRYKDMLKTDGIPVKSHDSIELMREILDAMNRQTGVICTMTDSTEARFHITYIKAVCHNIFACLCISVQKDEAARAVAHKGFVELEVGAGMPILEDDRKYWAVMMAKHSKSWTIVGGNLAENYVIACYNTAVKWRGSAINIQTMRRFLDLALTAYDAPPEWEEPRKEHLILRVQILQTKVEELRSVRDRRRSEESVVDY